MLRKIVLMCASIVIVGIGNFPQIIPSIQAEELVESKGEKVEQLTTSVDSEVNINHELTIVENELKRLDEQMLRMKDALEDNQKVMTKTEQEIISATREKEELENDVVYLMTQIEKRNEVLKERAKAYQESGGKVDYINIFLGASSFRDLVERVGVVTKIVNADQDLLDQQEADKKLLETKQKAIQKKLSDLISMKTELKGMQDQLTEQKQQNELTREQLLLKIKTMHSDLASGIELLKTVEVTNPDVKQVITAGFKYIGNSVYVFGGGRTEQDIENGRFDCSAFVHWAYTQIGMQIGSSTDTLKNSGTQLTVSEMQPGDLVFFDTYKKDGHVGIYLGNGKFIGSQSSTGVAVADMITGYWNETFNGRVVRLIES